MYQIHFKFEWENLLNLIACKIIRKKYNFVLEITAENFSKKSLKVEVSNAGEKPPVIFNRLYCDYGEKNIFRKLLSSTKFGFTKDLEELINRWDDGFICANEKVHTGKFMDLLLFIYK